MDSVWLGFLRLPEDPLDKGLDVRQEVQTLVLTLHRECALTPQSALNTVHLAIPSDQDPSPLLVQLLA